MNDSLLNATRDTLFSSSPFVSNLVAAVVWILLGLILGKILGKVVERVLRDFQLDRAVKYSTGIKNSLHRIIGGAVSFGIYTIFIVIALNTLGITHLLLNIISIAIIVVLFISLLLTIKDAIPNIVAYRQIVRQIQQGDKLRINSVDGEVLETSLFEVIIKAGEDELHVPNRLFLKEAHLRRTKSTTSNTTRTKKNVTKKQSTQQRKKRRQ